ncbi:hypothetical protein [Sinorhizobium meliloti]|uniref:hypothetical protein n=1 Tax=Rhizobium meliloti TaxID=382 RepID=UPI003F139A56
MNGEFVADIVKGQADMTGSTIETVFSKVSNIYAVYGTADRVMVQFADDPKLGSEQRLALSPLNPVRGEINGLIDGWRSGSLINSDRKKCIARRFDRRTADALTIALQGDQPHAATLLKAVKADLLDERTSMGRAEYLIMAIICAIIMFLGLKWLSIPGPTEISQGTAAEFMAGNYIGWTAGLGCLGALFSIALGIRTREIRTDLRRRDNLTDAVLRIFIGAISAVILFSLLKSELVAMALGRSGFEFGALSSPATHVAILVAFLAGFSERLVGDLLGSTAVAAFAAENLQTETAHRIMAPTGESNEQNPRGRDIAAKAIGAVYEHNDHETHTHGDDGVDNCVCDIPLEPDEATDDAELPEASGGVARAA